MTDISEELTAITIRLAMVGQYVPDYTVLQRCYGAKNTYLINTTKLVFLLVPLKPKL
jgi:hypothetical protein